MASQPSPRSHVSSRSSFFSLWSSSLFGRPLDPQVQSSEQDEGRNETTGWRNRGLGTISPWANAIPTIIVPSPLTLAPNLPTDRSSPSEPRHPAPSPSSARPMPERNVLLDEDDAFGQRGKGACGPGLTQDATLSNDETPYIPAMRLSLESGDGRELTNNRRQGVQTSTSSGTPDHSVLFETNDMTQVDDISESAYTGRLLRKPTPRSFGGERIRLSTFLAQQSLDKDMALVIPAPGPPGLDVVAPALTVNITPHLSTTYDDDLAPSSSTLSRNPSSSTNTSSHGPATDDSHLQTSFEPAIVETPPSFGQLWGLMDRAKAYPFAVQDMENFERVDGQPARGGETKESESKEDPVKQLKQLSPPLDEFNDFGPDASSQQPFAPLSTLSQPHSDNMAAVTILAPAIPFTKPRISAHSSDTSLSTSSYFTAKPFSTTRPSSTDTNGQARRPSATRLKSASAEDIVYPAITHDEGEGSPSRQRTAHRPVKRRESPPSASRRPDMPLPPTTHLPYHGPFEAYATDPEPAGEGSSTMHQASATGSPTSWIILSPKPGSQQLGDANSTADSTAVGSRRNSLLLRAAPQPPRLIRSLSAPRKSQRTSPSRGGQDRSTLNVDDGERALRPSMLPRSESFKRVFRRWPNRSSGTLEEPPVPQRSSSDPPTQTQRQSKAAGKERSDAATRQTSSSPERPAKKPFCATSSNNRLRKQRSVDDAKTTVSGTAGSGRVPLPRTSSLQGPPIPPPPRQSSIPILIPSPSTSLALSRKLAISWAPSPKAKALPGIDESINSARTVVINEDISAEFGRGNTSQLSKSERYRRCQSLVDIHDDLLFKQMVEDLPGFGSMDEISSRYPFDNITGSSTGCETEGKRTPPDVAAQAGTDATHQNDDSAEVEEGAVLMTRSRSLPGRGETRAKRDHVWAWFVTREIVQGEKRYGRLLARGVAVLEILVKQGSLASPAVGRASAPSAPYRATFAPHDTPADSNLEPLDILSNRLPQLLSLSISLSALFDLTPSPSGISSAFVSLEAVLVEQLGAWASEIGSLLINCESELLDVSISALSTPGASRSSSFGNVEDFEQEERLSFADIVIMPIQRALRYNLLFQGLSNAPVRADVAGTFLHGADLASDLLSKVPAETQVHTFVTSALSSADKIADECNARQTVDVSAFRRRPTGSSTRSATISDETVSPARLNKPDPRQKRRSISKDRPKKGHSKNPSISSTKAAKDDTSVIIPSFSTGSGKASTTSISSRPKAKRRISAGPVGLNTADSPIKTKDRSSWSLF